MTNKVLVSIIVVLIPICLYICFKSVPYVKTDNIDKPNDIIINLSKDNQEIELSLDNYLIGVVGAEMPATFNIEALKLKP